MINWKVRIQNKMFWLAIIPAILLLLQHIAGVFGYTLDFTVIGDRLISVVESTFVVLTILGIVADPTTAGVKDSHLAMTYEKPKEDK